MRDYRDYRYGRHRRRDHGTFGFVILIIGLLLLSHHLGLYYFHYHILWPVILIALGLFIGIKSKFRNNGPFILMGIGVLNLIPRFEIWNVSSSELAVPVMFILGGLLLILRPRRKFCPPGGERIISSTNAEDVLNIDVTFGGRKAIVTSKQFKGGNIAVAFAGAEINLMQADSTETMVLDMKVSFGGVEIVVPSHWDVVIDMQPSFGNVEDHRGVRTPATGEQKRTLVLRGTCSFGNVELKSY
jgi:predicted membrane protein